MENGKEIFLMAFKNYFKNYFKSISKKTRKIIQQSSSDKHIEI